MHGNVRMEAVVHTDLCEDMASRGASLLVTDKLPSRA
jgi:hypothetical protein